MRAVGASCISIYAKHKRACDAHSRLASRPNPTYASTLQPCLPARRRSVAVPRRLQRSVTPSAGYSSAVRAIKQLEAWWVSLSEVEKASITSIRRLVLRGEGIIMGEVAAWGSTGGSAEEELEKAKTKKKPETAATIGAKREA